MHNENAIYTPVMRLKKGEYDALRSITTAVANKIAPFFVPPPPKDSDPEKSRVLSPSEFVSYSGKRIGEYWPMRLCYVEPRYLFEEYGATDAEQWLPRMFEIARANGGIPIPVAPLEVTAGVDAEAFKKSIAYDLKIKLGLRVQFADINGDLKFRVASALEAVDVSSDECTVFIDFADADMSDAVAVSEFLSSAYQSLQEIGTWANMVFLGTNFPDKNPAIPEKIFAVTREEWKAWKHLIAHEPEALYRLTFGDYGADNAKFKFSSGAGKPIPHLRYCTDDEWLICRGRDDVKFGTAIKQAATMVLNSSKFMSREFSRADDRILQIAKDLADSGGASLWRELNMAHHITKVVKDLGKFYGYSIDANAVEELAETIDMFNQ